MTSFIKDPQAVLDYSWDWSTWLAQGEAITTAEVTATGTVEIATTTHDDTTVTAWVTGGTPGQQAFLTCRVTTNAGRTDDRTITLHVTER